MTTIYIVQWCNTEEYETLECECFTSTKNAYNFLEKIIKTNYVLDHYGKVPEYEMNIGEVIEPEVLFPYLYKITETYIKCDYSF